MWGRRTESWALAEREQMRGYPFQRRRVSDRQKASWALVRHLLPAASPRFRIIPPIPTSSRLLAGCCLLRFKAGATSLSDRPPSCRADHEDELRRLLDVPGDHLRRRAPAARRLLPLRLLQLAVLHLPAADHARLRPRHRLLRLRHPQDAAGAAGNRRRPALLHPRLKTSFLHNCIYIHAALAVDFCILVVQICGHWLDWRRLAGRLCVASGSWRFIVYCPVVVPVCSLLSSLFKLYVELVRLLVR